MPLTKDSALWIDANGRVACIDHAGHYLRTTVEAVPHSLHVFTPLGDWMRVPKDTIETYTCENC